MGFCSLSHKHGKRNHYESVSPRIKDKVMEKFDNVVPADQSLFAKDSPFQEPVIGSVNQNKELDLEKDFTLYQLSFKNITLVWLLSTIRPVMILRNSKSKFVALRSTNILSTTPCVSVLFLIAMDISGWVRPLLITLVNHPSRSTHTLIQIRVLGC